MNGELFPLWQVDRREYACVCTYLGVEPVDGIYDRLSQHLAAAPFTVAPPRGLARFLARPPLTAFRLARLDQATRLFFPDHPVRHVLNTTLALHECHGPSYRALSHTPTGGAVWWAMAGWGLRFVGGMAVTLAWLALQAATWALSRLFMREGDLAGRRVLVTGVGRGLGRDLMLECLDRGASVVGTVRTPEAARALRAELPAVAPLRLMAADLAQPGAAVSALAAEGVDARGLDLLVLCAGVKHAGRSALEQDAMRDTLQVNLLSAVELADWFTRGAKPDADNKAYTRPDVPVQAVQRLVVVSSMGRWHGMHGSGGYNAAKAALSIWAESVEMDLQRSAPGRFGVTVVEPGLFASGMTHGRGPMHWLLAPRRRVAGAILDAAAAGRRTSRPPAWFAGLTWGVCAAGRSFRARLFGRVKPEGR